MPITQKRVQSQKVLTELHVLISLTAPVSNKSRTACNCPALAARRNAVVGSIYKKKKTKTFKHTNSVKRFNILHLRTGDDQIGYENLRSLQDEKDNACLIETYCSRILLDRHEIQPFNKKRFINRKIHTSGSNSQKHTMHEIIIHIIIQLSLGIYALMMIHCAIYNNTEVHIVALEF